MSATAGVDTTAFTMRIDDADRARFAQRRGRPVFLPGGVRVTLHGDRARVELSAAAYMNGVNVFPVRSMGEVRDVCAAAFDDARTVVAPVDAFNASRLVRLDAVRDFEVDLFGPHMSALARVLAPARAQVMTHRDGRRFDALTASVGNGHWRAYLYDKFAQSGQSEALRRARFEVRMLPGFIRRNGVSFTTPDDLIDAHRRRVFDDSGFGRLVRVGDMALLKVLSESALSPREALMFVGFLRCIDLGVPAGLSRGTVRKYLAVADVYGISPGAQGPREALRLDYGLGRQLRGPEAETFEG